MSFTCSKPFEAGKTISLYWIKKKDKKIYNYLIFSILNHERGAQHQTQQLPFFILNTHHMRL
ncbi:hypothetical protein IMPERIA89_590085 [Imperialibacter sp. 89]|nr:hypothetical protein IMPERIA75_460001 [Imperialibacter sp. 75]CAD5289188.1 hypothetical protein IMPERIA89_590085 [Imperialibacter sp. 89]